MASNAGSSSKKYLVPTIIVLVVVAIVTTVFIKYSTIAAYIDKTIAKDTTASAIVSDTLLPLKYGKTIYRYKYKDKFEK